jgi:hypothetical protein
MISGRADFSDDWLPARIRPVRGESFDSLCRRLAAAKDITPTGLLRGCMSKHPAPAYWCKCTAGASIGWSRGECSRREYRNV